MFSCFADINVDTKFPMHVVTVSNISRIGLTAIVSVIISSGHPI